MLGKYIEFQPTEKMRRDKTV